MLLLVLLDETCHIRMRRIGALAGIVAVKRAPFALVVLQLVVGCFLEPRVDTLRCSVDVVDCCEIVELPIAGCHLKSQNLHSFHACSLHKEDVAAAASACLAALCSWKIMIEDKLDCTVGVCKFRLFLRAGHVQDGLLNLLASDVLHLSVGANGIARVLGQGSIDLFLDVFHDVWHAEEGSL